MMQTHPAVLTAQPGFCSSTLFTPVLPSGTSSCQTEALPVLAARSHAASAGVPQGRVLSLLLFTLLNGS